MHHLHKLNVSAHFLCFLQEDLRDGWELSCQFWNESLDGEKWKGGKIHVKDVP